MDIIRVPRLGLIPGTITTEGNYPAHKNPTTVNEILRRFAEQLATMDIEDKPIKFICRG